MDQRLIIKKTFMNTLKKLEHLKIETKHTPIEIQKWWEQPSIQTKIDEMFCMNIIRWQFGCAIEMWILLDRACYLAENGYQIKWGSILMKISPPETLVSLRLNYLTNNISK